MYRIWEAVSGYYYGYPENADDVENVNEDANLSEDWVYIETEIEQILHNKVNLEQENRKKEIQEITNSKPINSRTKWANHFQSILDKHPLASTPAFTFNLPLSMRSSIMQQFIRGKALVWIDILKYFHDLHLDENFDSEKWSSFQSSFIRVPRFNNKGKEGAIIDFALLSYEGVISGNSLARILWAWSKTLMSFLDTDFDITLTASEVSELEEVLSKSVEDIIEMHIIACTQSFAATKKLGILQSKWASEKKEITTIDAKYVALEKTLVLDSEKPKESMIELQNNLMTSLVGGPIKRQIEEIPVHERMIMPAFYDAKFRLQAKFEKLDRFQRLEH